MKKMLMVVAIAAGCACAQADTVAGYVQDGLIAHWDAIDNAGTGTHDPNAATWKDLTGKTGDFTIQTSVASFTGGNALKKNANGYMAKRSPRRTDIKTIEVAASGFPSGNVWTMLVFVSSDQNITLNDGNIPGLRLFFFDYKIHGVKTLAKPSKATFSLVCAEEAAEWRFYQNGTKPESAGYLNYWGDGGDYISLGGRVSGGGSERSVTGYSIYSVRFYDRELTAAEVAANAAVDKERFGLADGYDTPPTEGWLTLAGTFPYAYPVYLVDIATGGSNSIDEVTFKRVESAGASTTTDVSYVDFTADALTGTIVKRGGGTLTFDKDISTFTGPVHIEEGVGIGICSNCFGYVNASADSSNQRIFVHSGATLVMDAIGNKPVYSERNALYYEGDGYPGMGGALVWRNGNTPSGSSRWQAGVTSRPVGTAKIFLDIPSGATVTFTYGEGKQAGTDFSIDNQDVLMYGRTVGSTLSLGAAYVNGFKNLVFSNMTVNVNGNSGRIIPKNGNASTLRFTGGARWLWNTYDNLSLNQLSQTATLYIDDMEYASFDCTTWTDRDNNQYGVNPWGVTNGTTNNWYCGPVVLNDDFRMRNNYSPRRAATKRLQGCTFSAQVRGPKGFRPWANANGEGWGDGLRLNLLYPTNTFEGGIAMDGGSLGVWAERTVPSQEGAGLVSITNGYIYFGRQGRAPSTKPWPVFEMPVTEFVGSGAVTNGTGRWQGLVKKGVGTLDYNSQLDGDFLDLQEGIVKFSTQYRAEYADDNAVYAPAGYEAALPAFTTLKGTTGRLDLEGVGGAYAVTNMFGTPSVTNGDLTVTGTWTLDATTLGVNTAKFSGALAFGEGASIAVSGDLDAVANPHGAGYLVAKAASVTGLPRFHAGKWLLLESDGEVRLFDGSGTMLIFR